MTELDQGATASEKPDSKINAEFADREFYRFCDLMDLDVDDSKLDEEEAKSLADLKTVVTDAVMAGSLVFNDDGEPTYTPQRSDDVNPITFKEPTGATMTAMDRKKQGEDAGKLFATMAQLSGVGAKTFVNMKNKDLKVLMALVTLFLG